MYYESASGTNVTQEFGLVDIFVMPWVPWFYVLKLDDLISKRANFEAWWKRVTVRPSWQLVQESQPKTQ